MVTACAFTQLILLISGVQLGGALREESSDTIVNYTEQPLLFVTRGFTALIAVFTIIGMSTKQWIGFNTIEGWSGSGTFCRHTDTIEHPCVISIVTTILSVVAAVVPLLTLVLVVCGIFNAIKPQFGRYAVPLLLFITVIILWSTVATLIPSEVTGYLYRLIIMTGLLAQLALAFGGIWLSISRKPDEIVKRWI